MPLMIGCLLLHGVFTLMWFYVDPVFVMPYCYSLVGGLPLRAVLVFLKFAKFSKLSSLLVPFKLLVGVPNRHRPCNKPNVLSPNLVVAVASALRTGLLFLESAPEWPPALWLQQYVVLHYVGRWGCPSCFHLGFILPFSLLATPAPP